MTTRGAIIKVTDDFVVELLRHCTNLPPDVEAHRSNAQDGLFSIVVKSGEFDEVPEGGAYPYFPMLLDSDKVRGWFGLTPRNIGALKGLCQEAIDDLVDLVGVDDKKEGEP